MAEKLTANAAASVAVECAWGADLTDMTGTTWAWVDITADVRQADGINVALGRSDEASTSQPATLSLTLDNATAAYSLGGHSPNYPNVRRNVPVRVRIDPGDGVWRVAFQGYANGFQPGWDSPAGRVPVAHLEASGVLRRLAQGQDPLRSALYRFLTLSAAPVEYWPLEEVKAATEASNAAPGGAVGVFEPTEDASAGQLYGKVEWGGDEDNPATERAVQLSEGGLLSLPVRASQFEGNYWAVSWSMRYPSTAGAFVRLRTNDLVNNLFLYTVFYSSGTVETTAVTKNSQATMLSWNHGDSYLWDDVWHHYVISVDQTNASTATWRIYRDGVLMDAVNSSPGFRGLPTEFEVGTFIDPDAKDPIAVAHVAYWNSAPDVAKLYAASRAHVGESATARLSRLCTEEDVALEVVGAAVNTMGPQMPVAFLDLARECETVDQGVLYDGVGPGLRYVCRDQRENAAASLVLDAAELVSPFEPVDDDQRTRNRMTASGTTGGKFTHEDIDGPMGTATIGVYDGSVDVNTNVAGDVPAYAAWAVHLGTVEGYRYPAVTLNLRSTPDLAAAVLALEPSDRVTVENIGAVLAAMPTAVVELLVEGLAMGLAPAGWTVTLKCSPFVPWMVGTLAAETGDTGDDSMRLDTDGSTLATGAPAGATALSVATPPPGLLWTTAADDFPLMLDVGGVQTRATGCSGASSPQTFTVDPLPVARPAGAAVSVWNPPVLGL